MYSASRAMGIVAGVKPSKTHRYSVPIRISTVHLLPTRRGSRTSYIAIGIVVLIVSLPWDRIGTWLH